MKKLTRSLMIALTASLFFVACGGPPESPVDPEDDPGIPAEDEGTEEDLVDDDFDEQLEDDLDGE